ncbi:Galactose mutarotase-like superfamily protein [Forsythia ovata]|uniref:glucose-6-phosphate 1-epimerase n=1 Tax=Forsythia ovata TaxID=205694 RepID=A0ABD1R3B9_9LAMI
MMSSTAAVKAAIERVPVEICKGINGLEKVVLREVRGSSAEVYLYGGHITSWKNDHGEELLFVSSKAIFKPPKPIRGGIPICFPQFSNHGSLEQHGFARNRFWSFDTNPPPFPTNSSNKTFVDLILKPSEDDIKIWPHSFEFRLRVTLGPSGDLMLTSRIRNTNTDGKPFTFTFAYHTYFSVSDISEVRVEGLETLDYLDNLQNKKRFTEQGDAITFESEVDKIYLSTPTKIAILDHEKKRTFVIRKDGLPDAVVWNPWDKKAKAMADFGDDEYKHMLCVEAAAVEKPITLKPVGSLILRESFWAAENLDMPILSCTGALLQYGARVRWQPLFKTIFTVLSSIHFLYLDGKGTL